MYKTISFKFSNKEEIEEFLNYISNYIKIDYYAIVRENNVYVQLSGPPQEIKRAIAAMKTGAGLVRAKLNPYKAYPLDVLFKKADIPSPVPPDTIVDYLAAAGYEAKIRGLAVYTDAPEAVVVRAIERLSEAYRALEDSALTPHAKRLAAVYMAAAGAGLEEAGERLAAAGILNKGDVYSLAVDLQTARGRLRALVGRALGGKGYKSERSPGHDVTGVS